MALRALTTTLPLLSALTLVQAGFAPIELLVQEITEGATPYVFPQKLYVAKNAPAGGDGSESHPFNTLAAGIAAAPGPVLGVAQPCVLMLAPGDDYSSEGTISYADKAITFIGLGLLNISGTTFTHGLFLRVTSTGDVPLGTTIIGCNSQFQPNSNNLTILLFNAYCEQNGDAAHVANVVQCGSTPLTCRSVGNGGFPNIGSLTINGGSWGGGNVGGGVDVRNGYFDGAGSEFTNLAVAKSTIAASKFGAGFIKTHHPLYVLDCTFADDATSVVFQTVDAGAVFTDRVTYALGVRSGVTWPNNTTIIETLAVAPQWVSSSAGVNSNTNLTDSYGANVAGDRFIARVTVNGFVNPPVAPAGWSQIGAAVTVGNLRLYTFGRDAVSTGGEVGPVTFTVAAGNFMNSMVIDTWRFSNPGTAVASYVESIVTGTSVDPGGVIAGPTVTPTAPARTAVCIIASNGVYPPNPTVITGAVTGGTWQARNGFGSGLGGGSGMQTAQLAGTTPVTGGTSTASVGGGTQYAVRQGFALIGAAP